MEREDALLCWQETTFILFYLGPQEFNPHPKTISLTHFNIILSSTSRSSEWFLQFRLSKQNFVHFSQLHHVHYKPRFISRMVEVCLYQVSPLCIICTKRKNLTREWQTILFVTMLNLPNGLTDFNKTGYSGGEEQVTLCLTNFVLIRAVQPQSLIYIELKSDLLNFPKLIQWYINVGTRYKF
jgi:hypothetical protein